MMKRALTTFLALSMTANIFLLSANADNADEAKESKAEIVEIKVTGHMADDWLAEYDEFSITFEHDGEEVHGYFDKDNKFERWIELQEGIEYNVTYSKELDGRLIKGFDETLTPSKDKTNYMFIVYPNHEDKGNTEDNTKEDKTEDSEEKDDKEKLDTAVKKLTMSEEELAVYKEQRELVQEFVNAVDSYGEWNSFSNDEVTSFIDYCSTRGNYYGYDDLIHEMLESKNCKDFFLFSYLYGKERYVFEKNAISEYKEDHAFITLQEDENITYLNKNDHVYQFSIALYPNIIKIWEYSHEQYIKTEKIPDLYAVYLDIKNGVEYEELKEESTSEELSNAESSSNKMESEENETFSITDDNKEISSIAKRDVSSDADEVVSNKKTFKDVLKDNIITIVLAIGLGIALLYIKTNKKKDNDNDY